MKESTKNLEKIESMIKTVSDESNTDDSSNKDKLSTSTEPFIKTDSLNVFIEKLQKNNSLDTLINLSGKEEIAEKLSEFFNEYMKDQSDYLKRTPSADPQITYQKSGLNMAHNKLHFVFLFSSPLVREAKGEEKEIMQLNWKSEIEDILDSLRQLNYSLNYKIMVGSRSKVSE